MGKENIIENFHKTLDDVTSEWLKLYENGLSENMLQFILADAEMHIIKKILTHTGNNHTKTAHILGISRATLINKVKKIK